MDVTFYYRADIQACIKTRRILHKFETLYKLKISEVPVESDDNIKAPAIKVAGSRLRVLDSSGGPLNEQTIQTYLELVRVSGTADMPERAMGSESATRRKNGPRTSDRSMAMDRYGIKSYMWQHRVGLMIAALSAFLGLAWVAPFLDAIGMKGAYSAIFGAYRLVCLQTPDRSPYVAGHQCCLCWRCVAIYAGSLLFGIVYTLGRDGRLPQVRMQWLTQSTGLKGLIIFSIPMFADGLSHTFGLRAGSVYAHSPDFWLGWGELQADWLLRMVTAFFATVGAVKFLCPRLDKIGQGYARQTNWHTSAPSSGISL